ncbi:MAG: hypothetical protein ABI647_24970, partial [Gemmatimonadota bacterium]
MLHALIHLAGGVIAVAGRRHRQIVAVVCLTLVAAALSPAAASAQRTRPSKGGLPGPAGVTVTAGAASAVVSWTALPDRGVTYRVLRALDAFATGADIAPPTDLVTLEDPKVSAGTTYFYQVVAVYADGTLGAAAPVAFTYAGPTQPALSARAPATAVNAPPLTLAPGATTPRNRLGAVPGPAPTGVVVTGTPPTARLTWNAMPNVARYAVWRGQGSAVSVERTPAGFTGTQFQDIVPDPALTYRYAIIAYYPNGTSAEAPAVQFTSPPLINPSGFTVHDRGQGAVDFQWQAVPGAIRYRLDGPGLPNTGYFATSTTTAYPHIPAGPGSWKLLALYPGNVSDSTTPAVVSAVIHVLPGRSQHWLTKNNGAGQFSQVEVPAHQDHTNPTAT